MSDAQRLASARDPEQFRLWGHGSSTASRTSSPPPATAPSRSRIRSTRRACPSAGPPSSPAAPIRLRSWNSILAETTVTHHPAYLGHQLAAPLPTATLTTLVTAVVNGSGAIYELSQSGTACESALARYLAGRLGMPATSGGMIVHGGTIATLTALLAARQAKAGFDVWRDGAHAGRRWRC